ncbi:SDR family NAD(P)-dependent oxidoreductase [Mycobacterium europaeum]|uniref:SDR family NAD(P)-dependent oxidoreductase n=1 Tax=Mycobacterium europaeum TaxID=761804 RepID=UPI000AA086B3|nr:SDR family NAD(P)-dependent oxidoreductase [Mycobacterium europaeum]
MKDLRVVHGDYAVVKGASSGIGEQFARHLNSARVNVVLVLRRKDRLEALAAELCRAQFARGLRDRCRSTCSAGCSAALS